MKIKLRSLLTITKSTMSFANSSYKLNHTCFRIKDHKVSVPFYEKNFGMTLLKTIPIPDANATLYTLGTNASAPIDKPWYHKQGLLELKQEHSLDSEPSFTFNNGNGLKDKGFGHICFSVDNIEECQSHLLSNGVKFQKKLTDGRQKNIAFALDPNGYWIELIENEINKKDDKTDTSNYRLNHSMIRVKDPQVSLKFYRELLGLKLISKRDFEDAKFSLYFLAYEDGKETDENLDRVTQAKREGILELTHNWGTESDDAFEGYHNGNDTSNGKVWGYGHIGICGDNTFQLAQYIEKNHKDIKWDVKASESFLKGISFLQDPDGYLVELLDSSLLLQLNL